MNFSFGRIYGSVCSQTERGCPVNRRLIKNASIAVCYAFWAGFVFAGSLLFSATALGQKIDRWHCGDEKTLYQMCDVFINANYPLVKNREPQKIHRCFAENIYRIVPNRADFLRLPPQEIVTIEAEQICNCITEILGVEITPIIRKIPDSVMAKNLVGHWFDWKRDFYLREDGTATVTYEEDRQPLSGRWRLSGKDLTIEVNRRVFGEKVLSYSMLGFHKNTFFYLGMSGNLFCVYRTIQPYNDRPN